MDTPIFQVDAFASEPFRGNPAGVCLLREEASDPWMQNVAMEMNLSETAFIRPRGDEFSIRYFTSLVEIPLCGHATLAGAHVLWEEGLVSPDAPIVFHTSANRLEAVREVDRIRLDFPARPVAEAEAPSWLEEALGSRPLAAFRWPEMGWLVELESEHGVRDLEPDLGLLRRGTFGGVIVTARCESGPYDFVSRFFAPDLGIDEDPVTGIAHCCLGPYWAARLGRTELTGHQVSGRGGVVKIRVKDERVELIGQAVTVIRGSLVT